MITKTIERINHQMNKVCKKIHAEELLFRYSDRNEENIKCLFGLRYVRILHRNTKQPRKEHCYYMFSARRIYRAAMSLNRHEELIRTTTFHDHDTVRAGFPKFRFVRMRWFLTELEKNARKYYWYI